MSGSPVYAKPRITILTARIGKTLMDQIVDKASLDIVTDEPKRDIERPTREQRSCRAHTAVVEW